MSQPPRALESIIRSLGADPYLADVVLGDLAEEFAERAAFDGELEARRWYTTEAMRSIPHLMRSAFARLSVGDVPRLVGIALFSWLALLPISLTAFVIVAAVLRAIGVDVDILPVSRSPGFIAIAMLAMPPAGFFGGHIAAWRNARAPLIGAAAFGLVLTSINLVAGLFYPSPLPVTYRIAALAIFNVAAIIGGVVRAARLKPSAAGALSTS